MTWVGGKIQVQIKEERIRFKKMNEGKASMLIII
jgi:hypothetical protein